MNIALITGASSGLGREFALRVAADEKIDKIILIARRECRLTELAEKIGEKAQPLALDLTKEDMLERIDEAIGDNSLTLAVNCAGFGKMGAVGLPDEQQAGMVELNCTALTKICAYCASKMPNGAKIINIASIAAFVPTPNLAVYGATKAYVLSLSKAMHKELKDRRITVTAVCSGPINTEFFAVAGIKDSKLFDSLIHMSPEYVAKRALKASKKGRWVCTPHPLYKAYRVLSKLIPDKIFINFTKA